MPHLFALESLLKGLANVIDLFQAMDDIPRCRLFLCNLSIDYKAGNITENVLQGFLHELELHLVGRGGAYNVNEPIKFISDTIDTAGFRLKGILCTPRPYSTIMKADRFIKNIAHNLESISFDPEKELETLLTLKRLVIHEIERLLPELRPLVCGGSKINCWVTPTEDIRHIPLPDVVRDLLGLSWTKGTSLVHILFPPPRPRTTDDIFRDRIHKPTSLDGCSDFAFRSKGPTADRWGRTVHFANPGYPDGLPEACRSNVRWPNGLDFEYLGSLGHDPQEINLSLFLQMLGTSCQDDDS